MSAAAHRVAITATLALLLSTLAACAGFGPSTPRLRTAETRELVPAAWEAGRGAWPADGWWRSLGEPDLDRLIDAALADAPNAQAAAARLRSANAAAQATRALRSPTLGVSGEASEQRFSGTYFTPPQYASRNLEVVRGSLDAGYDFDLWGRQRAALEAAVGQASAARAELAQARLLLSTAIVQTWYGAVADMARLARARALLAERTLQRQLIDKRADAGLETVQARDRTVLAAQDAALTVERLQQSLALTRNQLLALVGRGELDDRVLAIDERKLDAAPAGDAGVPARLPLELVARRPDLAAQLARVDAARALIASQRAEFYPSVNLAGFVGLQAIGLNNLLSSDSVIGSVGPTLRLPILDGGRLRAALVGREADYDAAVAQYNQLLVGAVREVADQVTLLARLDDQARLLDTDLAARRRLEDTAGRRLARGLDTRLQLADARAARLAGELAWIDLRAARANARVALVRALGGGYDDARDTSPR